MEVTPRISGRVIVGHPRRHHLYHTAIAYIKHGQPTTFVTEVFVAARWMEALLRGVGRLVPACSRLSRYYCEPLEGRVLVASGGVGRRSIFRLMGNDVYNGNWVDAILHEARENVSAVHLPCVHAREVFSRIKSGGPKLYLEQYIADRRLGRDELIKEGHLLNSPLAENALAGLGFGLDRIEKNEAEYEMSDRIVAGSHFVKETIVARGISADKVVLAEYGVDLEQWPYIERHRNKGEVLKVAFSGSGALRKGLIRLLRAARAVGNIRVMVFGNVSDLPGGRAQWGDIAVFYGHLPQPILRKRLEECHAAALPTLWEGSAYVVGESLASGMPMIVTPNAGSWVRDGIDGYIVPARDEDAIARSLMSFQDEGRRLEMGREARRNAERHSWECYHAQLRETLMESV